MVVKVGELSASTVLCYYNFGGGGGFGGGFLGGFCGDFCGGFGGGFGGGFSGGFGGGRMESGVLGNALDGVPECEDEAGDNVENPEKMTEDEKEHVGVKVMEALEENFETHREKINELVYGHTKNDYDDEDEIEEEDSQDDVMASEVQSGDKIAEDEDPSNLQRAWEMLELAKNIYSRMAGTSQADCLGRLCDTLLSLGEVSIENDNYSQAVEDITSCLEKRKDKLPHEARQMAEVQYQP